MKVIIIGVSGMVGQGVLRECLAEPEVTEVLAVVRSATGLGHPKFREIVNPDFLRTEALEPRLAGFDACFFCLGASAAGLNETDYAAINHALPVAYAATLARVNPGMTFIYVSGAGTDSSERGRKMWARVKGRTENDLLRLDLNAVMFRPGLIRPMHGEVSRTRIYRIGIIVLKPLFPMLRRLFPSAVLTTEIMGRAMLHVARLGSPKRVLEARDISEMAESQDRG
jgi:uncharacterized protein YbjT (DUF2867 family)